MSSLRAVSALTLSAAARYLPVLIANSSALSFSPISQLSRNLQKKLRHHIKSRVTYTQCKVLERLNSCSWRMKSAAVCYYVQINLISIHSTPCILTLSRSQAKNLSENIWVGANLNSYTETLLTWHDNTWKEQTSARAGPTIPNCLFGSKRKKNSRMHYIFFAYNMYRP